MIEGLKTVNSAVRTLLLAILVIVVGYTGYVVYREYTKRDRLVREQQQRIVETEEKLISLQSDLEHKAAEVQQLSLDVQQKAEQIIRLETAMQLLKTDQRLAKLTVIDIERNQDGMALTSTLEFVELSPQGNALAAPRRFELPGDVVYIDNWVVKFDDDYIEQGDIQRGTSLCLFRRIFSESQKPTDGISLDEVGMRPQAYARGGQLTDFERQLWSDFWEFANDPSKAAAMGIRAANGEAVSIQVREGMQYNVSLRSSGGLSIEPISSGVATPTTIP